MSSPKLPVNLSPEAWDDLEDIALYSELSWSELSWGEEQRDRYLTALDQALLRLSEFPQLGRSRGELHPNYRSLQIEQHIVIYEVLSSEVYVVRILHRSRDLRRALRE